MTALNRRAFLRHSILGASGAIVAAPALAAAGGGLLSDDEKPALLRRPLGRTGLTLPIVSFGVMRADNPGLIRAALKAGMVHFDTAHGYQGGANEAMLGQVLSEYPRESFVVATKVKWDGPEDFKGKFLLSLRRLQMEYVDILYVHSVTSRDEVLDKEILGVVREIRDGGRAKHLGVSTHKNEPEVIRAAIESGVYEVVLTAINFRQDHVADVKAAAAEAASAGIGIVAMKTMAGAFFDKNRTDPINCKAALKWVLQDEYISTSIPGITGFDTLAENAGINADVRLTAEERASLRLEKAEGGLYCNGCEVCTGSCSRALPIPELMRSYMYTYGYGNAVMGRDLVTSLRTGTSPCAGCETCTTRCVKGFNIRERIADVSRLAAMPEELLAGAHGA
jgi:predicted aldo/keto reductase-like oxidoreductase